MKRKLLEVLLKLFEIGFVLSIIGFIGAIIWVGMYCVCMEDTTFATLLNPSMGYLISIGTLLMLPVGTIVAIKEERK